MEEFTLYFLQLSKVTLGGNLPQHRFGIIEFFGLSGVDNNGSSIDFQRADGGHKM